MYPLREEAIFARKAKMLSSAALILPVRASLPELSGVLSLSIAEAVAEAVGEGWVSLCSLAEGAA